ncbi:MAG: sulfurtransferase, partial [Ilumatobacteraceae bacterium]
MVPLNEVESKVPSLISVAEVRAVLDTAVEGSPGESSTVIADVRWYLDGRDAHHAFNTGRIPGAVFVDVDRDLADHRNTDARRGRHPLPSPEDFARSMARLGIGDRTHVIAYDDTGGMTAARLVVMLRMIGRSASLMNGGLKAWTAQCPDRWETGAPTSPMTAVFNPTPWPTDRLASIETVGDLVYRGRDDATILIDARAADRFEGRAPAAVPAIDPRPGHIPGALNAPWAAVLDADTALMRSPNELRRHFGQLGIDDSTAVIASCGSGVSACLNLLALEHAGLPPAQLFVASWSGWASDPLRSAETGPVQPLRSATVTDPSLGVDAVHALRRARQRNRLADIEWFEALYRVYLAAFVFGGSILFISGWVPDDPVSAAVADDVLRHGPAWLGVLGALAVAMGLRSGSRGGPLAIEDPDVRHLLLAPVSRARVLLRPAVQRLRTIGFAAAAAGAVAGQLAGRRLPGSSAAWAMGGTVFGLTIGVFFVATALIAHGAHLHHGVSTVIGGGLLTWQMASAVSGPTFVGPADLLGGSGLWGERTRPIEIVPPVVAVLAALLGLALLGRQSLEALGRRSALVAQLRFAVTLQDLRTVALLRRQLSHERCRSRPWIRLRRGAGPTPEWHRGWQGILRFPASRLARLGTLTIVAGLCLVAAYTGTTAAIVGAGLAMFVLGLEVLEPLAQETDQGDRSDSYPKARGSVFLALLAPSFVAAIPLAALMTITMVIVEPEMAVTALIVSLPAVAAGVGGAAINIVAGTPDQVASTAQQNLMPSEVAGTVSLIK